jgi:UDPglucose 6-dehydrogenase
LEVLKAVEFVNDKQKMVLFNKVDQFFGGDLKGKQIGLLGLSFKPNTDDMREAPSLVIIDQLLKSGCIVKAYDPAAMEETERKIGNVITYCQNTDEVLEGADALLLVTEWGEFRTLDPMKIKELMKTPVVFDGRNIYDPIEMAKGGITYFSIGRV